MTTPYESKAMRVSQSASALAALFAAAGVVVLFGPCERSIAQQNQASQETRAMILGPLQAELPSNRIVSTRSDFTASQVLGRSPSYIDFIGSDSASSLPDAARLAGVALSVRSDSAAMEGFSAFYQAGATLVETPSGGRISVSLFDGRAPDAALSALSDSYADIAGSTLDPAGRSARRMTLRYENAFDSHGGPDGLDVSVAPRAGVSIGQNGPAAEAGATVRLGQYLDEGFGEDRPAWWFFAGADQQALMYDPGAGFDMRNALAMGPYATVGDAQAGIAARFGGADISFAYIQRETRYALPNESWETSEGFAAFSLTLRR
ncbi:lipid A-modifier LpxR family protein [Oceanicaulis sp. LC35]|uniref:lipid A-modifier LpxR family protein n=1 Tax=Oceanicaulis sp. LC35 TaxID=3349635 RepID=UPI003F86433E